MTQVSPWPVTATPLQLGFGQGIRSAQELAAALRLRSRYCSSSSTLSSRGMSASSVQHQALGPLGMSSRPASCSKAQSLQQGCKMRHVKICLFSQLCLQGVVADVVKLSSASSVCRLCECHEISTAVRAKSCCAKEDAVD